jgi:hypothetical protein
MERKSAITPLSQTGELGSESSPRPLVAIVILCLIVAGIIYTTLQGVSSVLPMAGFTVLSLLLMRVLPPKFPPLDVLLHRSQAHLRREVLPLLVYAVIFPVLTIPFVLWGRAGVIAVLPAWSKGGWVFSWNFLLCKVTLLLIPTIVVAVRLRSTGAELGLHGITGFWR